MIWNINNSLDRSTGDFFLSKSGTFSILLPKLCSFQIITTYPQLNLFFRRGLLIYINIIFHIIIFIYNIVSLSQVISQCGMIIS
jgi:hypothetical protein